MTMFGERRRPGAADRAFRRSGVGWGPWRQVAREVGVTRAGCREEGAWSSSGATRRGSRRCSVPTHWPCSPTPPAATVPPTPTTWSPRSSRRPGATAHGARRGAALASTAPPPTTCSTAAGPPRTERPPRRARWRGSPTAVVDATDEVVDRIDAVAAWPALTRRPPLATPRSCACRREQLRRRVHRLRPEHLAVRGPRAPPSSPSPRRAPARRPRPRGARAALRPRRSPRRSDDHRPRPA